MRKRSRSTSTFPQPRKGAFRLRRCGSHGSDVRQGFGEGPLARGILPPVEDAKSTTLSVWYPIWVLGKNPNARIALVSATHSQAVRPLAAIKEHARCLRAASGRPARPPRPRRRHRLRGQLHLGAEGQGEGPVLQHPRRQAASITSAESTRATALATEDAPFERAVLELGSVCARRPKAGP